MTHSRLKAKSLSIEVIWFKVIFEVTLKNDQPMEAITHAHPSESSTVLVTCVERLVMLACQCSRSGNAGWLNKGQDETKELS